MLATPGDRYVTDAGGNSLLRVAANGRVSLVASFAALPLASPPPLPASQTAEAVPTEVVIGPDGAFYVSTLTGAPFENGLAKVYRVVPGQAPTVYQGGFRTIIDIDFGPDGSLYVLEHSARPRLRRPGKAHQDHAGQRAACHQHRHDVDCGRPRSSSTRMGRSTCRTRVPASPLARGSAQDRSVDLLGHPLSSAYGQMSARVSAGGHSGRAVSITSIPSVVHNTPLLPGKGNFGIWYRVGKNTRSPT